MPSYLEAGGRTTIREIEPEVVAMSEGSSRNKSYKVNGEVKVVHNFTAYSSFVEQQSGAFMIFHIEVSGQTYDRVVAANNIDAYSIILKVNANNTETTYTARELLSAFYKQESGDYIFTIIRRVGDDFAVRLPNVQFVIYPDGVEEGSYSLDFDMEDVRVIPSDVNDVMYLNCDPFYMDNSMVGKGAYLSWRRHNGSTYTSANVYVLDMTGEKVYEKIGTTTEFERIYLNHVPDGFYRFIVKTISEEGEMQTIGRNVVSWIASEPGVHRPALKII